MTALDETTRRAATSRAAAPSRWLRIALPSAAIWALTYLGLGIAWLAGAGGNPYDPAVDDSVEAALLGTWSPQTAAAILTALAGLGVLTVAAIAALPPGSGPAGRLRRAATMLALGIGLVLAVVLPDYRLLATIAYMPILLVMAIFGSGPDGVAIWTWPVVNMAVLSVAGLAFVLSAVRARRQDAGACLDCGRSARIRSWATPERAARWGRGATALAVAIPVGYAVTRFAWAFGIPLGVSQELLDELGNGVWAGAGLATLAVGGAVLTLGLVQRWGETFPRWMVGLAGRRVPAALAVVPASIVSAVVTSAGLMFLRFGINGEFAANFPGENLDIAAWLPEMFWPLWGAALATATYAYWLRRRGTCDRCGHDRLREQVDPADGRSAGAER